jgi:hypothetical protein
VPHQGRVARPLASEHASDQRCSFWIRELRDFGVQLPLDGSGRSHRGPLALSEVDAAVSANAHAVDLKVLVPVLADLVPSIDALAGIDARERLATKPLEAAAEVLAQLWLDPLREGSRGTRPTDERALRTGEKSHEQLVRENSFILPGKMHVDYSRIRPSR